MKLTKSKIRQIIKEELEVVLTNEEVGDFFGKKVQAKLEEIVPGGGMMANPTQTVSAEAEEEAAAQTGEGGGDVHKIATESSMPEAAADLLGEPLPEEYSEVLHGIRGVLEMEEFADLDSAVREELLALYNDILERESAAHEEPLRLPKYDPEARGRFHQRQARAKRPRSPGDYRSQKDRMENP